MAAKSKKLTPKQHAFALAVIGGASPVDAYREAGYSEMSADSMAVEASRLMGNPKISLMIAEGREKAMRNTIESVSYSRVEAIKRLEEINEKAYKQIKEQKFISRDAMNAFFQSLDRLEDLTNKQSQNDFMRSMLGDDSIFAR